MRVRSKIKTIFTLAAGVLVLAGCATGSGKSLPSAGFAEADATPGENYIIGPLDELTVFVWRNPELGAKVQVRPDGRITTPLITDLPAAGKTPARLADDIKDRLTQYIEEPL